MNRRTERLVISVGAGLCLGLAAIGGSSRILLGYEELIEITIGTALLVYAVELAVATGSSSSARPKP